LLSLRLRYGKINAFDKIMFENQNKRENRELVIEVRIKYLIPTIIIIVL